jgi:hypothetical protein
MGKLKILKQNLIFKENFKIPLKAVQLNNLNTYSVPKEINKIKSIVTDN